MRHGTQLPLVFVDPRIPGKAVIDRFWSKVDRSGECWLWTAGKTADGYGGWRYGHDGQYISLRSHRFAFLVTHGALTEGTVLHHLCHTPACCRPDHLVEMTQADHLAITPGTYVHIQAEKTHCNHGHELSGDNLYESGLRRGVRQCKACTMRRNAEAREQHPEQLREAQRRYRERKRAEAREAHMAELEERFPGFHRQRTSSSA